MSMISDGQIVLTLDDALKVDEASSQVYSEVVFDFDKLFSEPLTEENMRSNNSLAILGESLAVLKKMKDKSVQLIFADAPYNIGKDFGNNSDKWESVHAYIEW